MSRSREIHDSVETTRAREDCGVEPFRVVSSCNHDDPFITHDAVEAIEEVRKAYPVLPVIGVTTTKVTVEVLQIDECWSVDDRPPEQICQHIVVGVIVA
jgi:hypothetical protein